MDIKERVEGQHLFLELWEGLERIGALDHVIVPPEVQIIDVFIEGPFRHQGCGSRLLTELLRRARAASLTKIFLEVRASNSAALGLYTTFGFVRTGIRKAYYSKPVEDAVLMERAL